MDNAGFKHGANEAKHTATDVAEHIKGAFLEIGAALGIGFGVERFVESIKGQIEGITELTHLADRTGIAVDNLRALQYEAKRTGTDFETLLGATKKMQINLGEAIEAPKGDKASVFSKMGLDPAQLAAMDPSQAFAAIGDKIAAIENPTLRVRAAFDVFGKTGAEALNAIEAGSKGLANARGKVGMLDPETIEEIHAAHEGMLDLDAAVQKLSRSFASNLAPGIATATEGLAALIKKDAEAVEIIVQHKKAIEDEQKLLDEGKGYTPGGQVLHASSTMDYLYGKGGGNLIQSMDDIPMNSSTGKRGLTAFEEKQKAAEKKAALAKAAVEEEQKRARDAASDKGFGEYVSHISQLEDSFTSPLEKSKEQLDEVYEAWQQGVTGIDTYVAAMAKVQDEQDKFNEKAMEPWKKMAEAADKFAEDSMTPLEKYKEKLLEISDNWFLTDQERGAAFAKAKEDFDKATEKKPETQRVENLGAATFGSKEGQEAIAEWQRSSNGNADAQRREMIEHLKQVAANTGRIPNEARERAGYVIYDLNGIPGAA